MVKWQELFGKSDFREYEVDTKLTLSTENDYRKVSWCLILHCCCEIVVKFKVVVQVVVEILIVVLGVFDVDIAVLIAVEVSVDVLML